MKHNSILLIFASILIVSSCRHKVEKFDLRKQAENFKYSNVEYFDIPKLPTDLKHIDDDDFLRLIWGNDDKRRKDDNYYYSIESHNSKLQEFTIVTGNPYSKDDNAEVWYFIYDLNGKYISRFTVAGHDKADKIQSKGKFEKPDAYLVETYRDNSYSESTLYKIGQDGNVNEEKTDKKAGNVLSGNDENVKQDYYPSDFFKAREMVYAGLDFTCTKFRGRDFEKPYEIKSEYFKSWNDVVVDEPRKYDISRYFNKRDVIYDISNTTLRNSYRSTSSMFTRGRPLHISMSAVQKVLYNVSLKRSKGIGLLFVVEYFDNDENEASMWVTIFDIASRKILIAERMTGEPSGTGVRNYWVNSVFNVMEKVNDRYNTWEKQY